MESDVEDLVPSICPKNPCVLVRVGSRCPLRGREEDLFRRSCHRRLRLAIRVQQRADIATRQESLPLRLDDSPVVRMYKVQQVSVHELVRMKPGEGVTIQRSSDDPEIDGGVQREDAGIA